MDDNASLILDDELPPGHRSGFVAVIGKPNVGKSTLINTWLGQKIAIVSPKPQTTRHRLRGILTRPDAQIIFVDTPGIHQPRHKLGEFMVETATKSIPDADVVLFMVDVSEMPTAEDEQIAQLIEEQGQAPVVLVLNKADLLPPEKVQPHSDAYFKLVQYDEWMMISATRGDNRDKLLDMVLARLPEGPRYFPSNQLTDQTMRFIAAELIREQVLRFLHQEVPHSVAVVVEEWKQRQEDLTYIGATIFVEKGSQKGIIIGEGGKMLKRIGRAAREEIVRLVGNRVYLDLWVKVRKKWRRDEDELRRQLTHYYALVTIIDEEIGRVIEHLREQGELDDTVIVYVADHGDFAGDHGLMQKNFGIYESIHRVPFILAYPGCPAGREVAELVESVDLYPTLCGLMDLDVPEGIEGRSLVPVIEGEEPGKDAAICEWSWTRRRSISPSPRPGPRWMRKGGLDGRFGEQVGMGLGGGGRRGWRRAPDDAGDRGRARHDTG